MIALSLSAAASACLANAVTANCLLQLEMPADAILKGKEAFE